MKENDTVRCYQKVASSPYGTSTPWFGTVLKVLGPSRLRLAMRDLKGRVTTHTADVHAASCVLEEEEAGGVRDPITGVALKPSTKKRRGAK